MITAKAPLDQLDDLLQSLVDNDVKIIDRLRGLPNAERNILGIQGHLDGIRAAQIALGLIKERIDKQRADRDLGRCRCGALLHDPSQIHLIGHDFREATS